MKTSPHFIDDTPLQFLILDADTQNGRQFFNSALGDTWFDYDLHMIENPLEATDYVQSPWQNSRALDLLFVSNQSWFEGGEEFVKQLRSLRAYTALPVYCIASCAKKLATTDPECMTKDWRMETDCDQDYALISKPLLPYLAKDHPAHLNGIVCGNNIRDELSGIIDNMATYWFAAGKD